MFAASWARGDVARGLLDSGLGFVGRIRTVRATSSACCLVQEYTHREGNPDVRGAFSFGL